MIHFFQSVDNTDLWRVSCLRAPKVYGRFFLPISQAKGQSILFLTDEKLNACSTLWRADDSSALFFRNSQKNHLAVSV